MESIIEGKKTITVTPFSESLKNDWDQFIDKRALNSTFLHTRKFYDHNSLNATDDASLIFYKEKRIVAVFPAVLYSKNGDLILHSHLRSTYGGVVVSKDVNLEIAVELVKLIIIYAKQKKVSQIIVRNPFRIYHKVLCDETDYAMWFHGFEIKSRELEIAIALDGDSMSIKSHYNYNTIRNLKKASKSVKVSISDDYREYWFLLETCLWQRHRTIPVHDYDSIMRLKDNLESDNIILFGAYHNQKLIAGILIFSSYNLVLHAQYIACDFNFQTLNPVHAIIDYLIDWGNERGAKFLSLGMVNEDEGRKINHGLVRFKESFGGRGVLRETMILNIV